MTDRPTLEDLDAEPSDGPWCCNGNAEDCALCTDPNPPYPFLCPSHPRTSANERIVGEATQATLYTTHGSAISAATVPPQTISIQGSQGPLVTIHLHDGRLEYGPGYTPDEAARLFWEALRFQVNPLEQAFGRPLTETINEHLAAGEAAEKRARELEAEVAAARRFAGEMRDFCSPHGVAVDYADRLLEAMDRAKEGQA